MSRRSALAERYNDSDKIECKVCGSLFIQITGKHLGSHNMTPAEYKQKFNVTSLISLTAQQKKMKSIETTEKTLSRTTWNKGIAATEEQKLAQSETMKYKFSSGELAHWNTGNMTSEETKNKISSSLIGHHYFDTKAIEKRNQTIQEKIADGWISPLKGRAISPDHREKSIQPFIAANAIKREDSLNLIKDKCKANNLELLNLEDNYYLNLKCTLCNTIFHNTRQVFNETKNNGVELCPVCFPKEMIVSKLEIEVRDYISKLVCGNIIYNDRHCLKGKELDILIPDKLIAIEFNGLYWHSTNDLSHEDHHILHKTQFAFKQGIRLITIFENEWISKRAIVESRLAYILGQIPRSIFARRTKVEVLSSRTAKTFLELNHIQGNSVSSINLGLYLDEELVSVMTFGKSRFDKNYDYELLRFCNKLNTSVVGGASKLFKYFLKNYSVDSIVTYGDKRWNTGLLYKNLGFTYLNATKPNYYYVEPNVNSTIHSRMQFQKHKLKDRLKVFDQSLSESQNMINNGYRKIWDCGNSKWEWRSKSFDSFDTK